MKTLLLGLVLLGNAAAPSAPVQVTFSPLTKAAYLRALKGKIVTTPRTTFPLKKQRGQLVISTAKGAHVFRDGWVDGEHDEATPTLVKVIVSMYSPKVANGLSWKVRQI